MHADARGFGAFVRAGAAAKRLAIANHAFAGGNPALAAFTGAFDRFSHNFTSFIIVPRPPCPVKGKNCA